MNIKKIISGFTLVSLVLISSLAFSQAGQQKLKFGVYIGPNFSNIDIKSPQLTAQTKSGYQAGLFCRSGRFLYGQAGLQYQVINSDFSMVDSSSSSGPVMFRRIQMPLYGGLNLIPIVKGVFNLRVYAGPVISYDFSIPENAVELTPADFNRFRIDGTIGAGMDVLIFSVDAGYTIGMSNLFKEDFDGKGNYAFVNVGLKF